MDHSAISAPLDVPINLYDKRIYVRKAHITATGFSSRTGYEGRHHDDPGDRTRDQARGRVTRFERHCCTTKFVIPAKAQSR
jgi:hypothetical protein